MNTPKHTAAWTPLRRALDRIRQDYTPTGKRVQK